MRLMIACAMSLAFLGISGCGQTVSPNIWNTVEPELVRDWCSAGSVPEITADGWWSCSAVTRDDAERLVSHKRLVQEKRNPK